MRRTHLFKILTLVLSLASSVAHTAPKRPDDQLNTQAVTPNNQAQNPEQKISSEVPDRYNLVVKSPPEPLKSEPLPHRLYSHLGSVNLRGLGGYTTDSDNEWIWGLGLLYQWPRFRAPHAEVGADMVAAFGGHIHFAVKYIFFERSEFRPFYSWGLTHEVRGEEKLATLTNINNYYARLSLGFEYLISDPKSLRVELQVLGGLEKIMASLAIGCAWGF